MKTVTLNITATESQVAALAQFVKRVGWREMRDNATDDDEAYDIRDGIVAVQEGLSEAGYSPR